MDGFSGDSICALTGAVDGSFRETNGRGASLCLKLQRAETPSSDFLDLKG